MEVKFVGGINGTIPEYVIINGGLETKNYFVPNQGLTGVNFLIDRPLRKKIFDTIKGRFNDLVSSSFLRFVEIIKSDQVRDICLTYGATGKKLSDISECPNCSSGCNSPITVGEGNTITGFLDASHNVYLHCNNCSLVYLSRQVRKNDLEIFYDTVSYNRSQNCRDVLINWDSLNEASTSHFDNYFVGIDNIKFTDKVLDLGCGSGDFLSLVRSARPKASLTGVDFHIPNPILDAMKRRNISGFNSDIVGYVENVNKSSKFDVITMWEVIEHLKIDDFKSLLFLIKKLLKPDGKLIFSTPDFYDMHTQSLDFWAMAPGEHLYVYNFKVCADMLSEFGFELVKYERESVTTKLPNRWYEYGAKTNSTLSGRASSSLIESILLDDELREKFKQTNRKNKIGSELIIIAKAQ
ncbi:class I SAM-dependent methyltransferase [Arenicellales bacterium nBUS_45]